MLPIASCAPAEIGCIITFTHRWVLAFSVFHSHCDILACCCMHDHVGVAGKWRTKNGKEKLTQWHRAVGKVGNDLHMC